jgi:hypothetical protein
MPIPSELQLLASPFATLVALGDAQQSDEQIDHPQGRNFEMSSLTRHDRGNTPLP